MNLESIVAYYVSEEDMVKVFERAKKNLIDTYGMEKSSAAHYATEMLAKMSSHSGDKTTMDGFFGDLKSAESGVYGDNPMAFKSLDLIAPFFLRRMLLINLTK